MQTLITFHGLNIQVLFLKVTGFENKMLRYKRGSVLVLLAWRSPVGVTGHEDTGAWERGASQMCVNI